MYSIIGFFLRHLPMFIAIIIFAFFVKFSFLKLSVFLWFFSSFYEAVLWQFPACIEIRIPIQSQRTNIEHDIINHSCTLKRRFIYFLIKLFQCMFDVSFIIGVLIASGLFTLGYNLFFK